MSFADPVPSKATTRFADRTTTTLVLAVLVLLFQVVALLWMGQSWIRSFPQPQRVAWHSLIHVQDEYFTVRETPNGIAAQARAVDLPGGRIRDLNLPILTKWHGLVADGHRVWIAANDSLFEINGKDVVQHVTRRPSQAVVRAGKPALRHLLMRQPSAGRSERR